MIHDRNDGETEEESSENDDSSKIDVPYNGEAAPSGAPAASQRAVQEAEKKAANACERVQLLEEEVSELRNRLESAAEEIEMLRGLSATHAYSLDFIFDNAAAGSWGKSLPDYEMPEELSEDVEALGGRETIDEE